MNLSVIIVTHNSADVLDRCLSGIDQKHKLETVIVDNASRDETQNIAKKHGVRLIANCKNQGFARAANSGAKTASRSHLCFLNPDCLPSRELFVCGLRAMGCDAYTCATPIFDEGDTCIISGRQPGYTHRKLLADILFTNYGDNRLYRALAKNPEYHDTTWWWAHGACFFIAKDIFLRMGGFDSRFYMYMEDVDLGRRLNEAGGKVVELDFQLKHFRGRSSRIPTSKQKYLLNMGRIRYARKYYGQSMALVVGLLAFPGWLLRTLMGRW
jgi:GT2 family glycosyltransferase